MFTGAHNFHVSGGTFNEIYQSRGNGFNQLYDHTLPDAAHDSYVGRSKGSCYEGTREQYIQDITSWSISNCQLYSHRLFWMYGPAGVGKSAIAKSCAITTAAYERLAASFFFSRDNGVVDPALFFTTIAHQIGTKTPEFREIVSAKIEINPALLTKGLETQFHELIITPFLELFANQVLLPRRTVFIDGLDECHDEGAQVAIIEMVTRSIKKYDNTPINAFPRGSGFPFFRALELPISRDYDAEIKLYLRQSLRLPISSINNDIVWPSERDLDLLVDLVSGLFVFAATVVRFIMDPNAFSPQQKLHDLQSGLRMELLRPKAGTDVTAELDDFYSLIMRRVSPSHLSVVRKILLIHVTGMPGVVSSHETLGRITLQELENCLAKLSSVLAIKSSESKRPGSAVIFFYHASFMEYLSDLDRSTEYYIHDARHYSDIALRTLDLSNKIYQMNGKTRNEKLKALAQLLSVFPDETFTPTQRFRFRDELFKDYLCKYTLAWWCYRSDLGPEILDGLRQANLMDPRRPVMIYKPDLDRLKQRLPIDMRRCITQVSPESLFPPLAEPDRPTYTQQAYPDVSANIENIWTYIYTVLFGNGAPDHLKYDCSRLIREVYKDSTHARYLQSQFQRHCSSNVQNILEWVKVASLDALDEFDWLWLYSNAWHTYIHEYQGLRPKFSRDPRQVPWALEKAIITAWEEVFLLMQGDDDRLVKAALRILERQWERDLLLEPLSAIDPGILTAFCESLGDMSRCRVASALRSKDYFDTKYLESMEKRYDTERQLFPVSTFLSHLVAAEELLMDEYKSHLRMGLIYFECHWFRYRRDNEGCTSVLMKGRWEEMHREFEALLDDTDCDDSDRRWKYFLWATDEWSDAYQAFKAAFEAHVKRRASTALHKTLNCYPVDASSPGKLGACASILSQFLEERLLFAYERNDRISRAMDIERNIFSDGIYQTMADILDQHPQLQEPFWRLVQELRPRDGGTRVWRRSLLWYFNDFKYRYKSRGSPGAYGSYRYRRVSGPRPGATTPDEASIPDADEQIESLHGASNLAHLARSLSGFEGLCAGVPEIDTINVDAPAVRVSTCVVVETRQKRSIGSRIKRFLRQMFKQGS
ncbi:hypothetical protein NP233_g146 [Leucocoprinus birnbaumii]|uniref:Nephrocystin 3-like N-terminal domain-containing protein n=1 Tax=Leucocoprinus birnbaumii TaxID=56174 RepID=A0AAD5W4M3_9AGAR|nr:hypothetical protein NP233_g146 [Leucocoprinus birnbaumii]